MYIKTMTVIEDIRLSIVALIVFFIDYVTGLYIIGTEKIEATCDIVTLKTG